jgi:ABC-2 type transport system permease protein
VQAALLEPAEAGQVPKSELGKQRYADAKHLAFVDEANIAKLPTPPEMAWRRYGSRDEAAARMLGDGVITTFVIRPDYVATGHIDALTRKRPSIVRDVDDLVPIFFRDYLRKNLLAGVADEQIKRALRPVRKGTTWLLHDDNSLDEMPTFASVAPRLLSGIGSAFLLFFSLAFTGGYLVQGMAEEKDNRVLELVLASVRPVDLMTGKLLGLGGAGLLQVSVWAALALLSAKLLGVPLFVDGPFVALCALFFLLGYALVGSLLLGIGSLGSNQREATQYTAMVSLSTTLPFLALAPLLEKPHGALAMFLSFVPLTAPTTMLLRMSVDPDGVAWWHIVVSALSLAVGVMLSLRLSARLFRVGLLLYGKQPTPREVWRWLREDLSLFVSLVDQIGRGVAPDHRAHSFTPWADCASRSGAGLVRRRRRSRGGTP